MENVYSIYKKLIINEVTYEMGDNTVKAKCELVLPNGSMETTFLISHSDLNRIMAKITSLGYEFKTEKVCSIHLEDGTEFVEYKFDNVFGEQVVLENFQFTKAIKELRA